MNVNILLPILFLIVALIPGVYYFSLINTVPLIPQFGDLLLSIHNRSILAIVSGILMIRSISKKKKDS
ncbi:hypothetical protein [Alteribacillus bidgolensis]|uniref:hypothetical protein n=1 Tax=Alteribacillus bidgolensis TaxID=930129 RepID=UPI000B8846AE|nr:hypothetical protein [Alteribacillus bidgolensis]